VRLHRDQHLLQKGQSRFFTYLPHLASTEIV
jgi:hypothetical protein